MTEEECIVFALQTALGLQVARARGGGHCRNFWVGMCRWEPGTLNLYQS